MAGISGHVSRFPGRENRPGGPVFSSRAEGAGRQAVRIGLLFCQSSLFPKTARIRKKPFSNLLLPVQRLFPFPRLSEKKPASLTAGPGRACSGYLPPCTKHAARILPVSETDKAPPRKDRLPSDGKGGTAGGTAAMAEHWQAPAVLPGNASYACRRPGQTHMPGAGQPDGRSPSGGPPRLFRFCRSPLPDPLPFRPTRNAGNGFARHRPAPFRRHTASRFGLSLSGTFSAPSPACPARVTFRRRFPKPPECGNIAGQK